MPALADASEGAAQRLQEPIAERIAHLVEAGELPAHLVPENQAARLRVLLDGLRLQLVTTPRQTTTAWALAVLDDHLTTLAASPAPARSRRTPLPGGGADGVCGPLATVYRRAPASRQSLHLRGRRWAQFPKGNSEIEAADSCASLATGDREG